MNENESINKEQINDIMKDTDTGMVMIDGLLYMQQDDNLYTIDPEHPDRPSVLVSHLMPSI